MIIDEDDLFELTEQEFIEKYDCTKEEYEYYEKQYQEM